MEDKRKNNGGKREGSGRKPLLSKEEVENVKLIISQHGVELDADELETKERILILLDRLYEAGKKGNVMAIKEYLDRQLGKSKESLDINAKVNTTKTLRIGYGDSESQIS